MFAVLGICVAQAGQQFKLSEIKIENPPGFTGLPTYIGVNKVASQGTLDVVVAYGQDYRYYASGSITPSGTNNLKTWVSTLGCNNRGDFVYNTGQSSGGGVRYADGTEIAIPTDSNHRYAWARDINDSGVVVGHYYLGYEEGIPFYMKNGVVTMPFPAGFQGTFTRVDAKGRAFFYTSSGDFEQRAGYWSPEEGFVFSSVGLSGGKYSTLQGMNDQAQSVDPEEDPVSGRPTARVTTLHSLTYLPAPSFSGGGGNPNAPGINNKGQIVLDFTQKFDGSTKYRYHWALWDAPYDEWIDLYAAVKTQVPAGWSFGQVKGIDDLGRVYGTMKRPTGNTYALVRLDPVPEPGTLAALVTGTLILLRRRTRR
ncbi:MAG: PEP-CTERM sorting domain-containing protein [Chthonomonas sp.]|nr:PEP-CTERM sorting domain-containing protein [Chthonomonas sp.]